MPFFERYIGIEYSGAETPTSSLKGLRLYMADRTSPSHEVGPPPGRCKYWTRRGIAEWMVTQLSVERPTLVGLDHGFSFPLRYFETHRLQHDWPSFLEDFQHHWPTDENTTRVQYLRHGNKRHDDASWFRLTELWTASAKSVFHFDIQGQVAKSTHAGLPWLQHVRNECRGGIHFWPFDGWELPQGRSVIAEVYPSLWVRRFPVEDRNADQQTAYAAAAWLQRADVERSVPRFFNPVLEPGERTVAGVEGWILGVILNPLPERKNARWKANKAACETTSPGAPQLGALMRDDRPKRDTMSLEEATISNIREVTAMVEVLERKGFCTKQDLHAIVTGSRRKNPRASISETTFPEPICARRRRTQSSMTFLRYSIPRTDFAPVTKPA